VEERLVVSTGTHRAEDPSRQKYPLKDQVFALTGLNRFNLPWWPSAPMALDR